MGKGRGGWIHLRAIALAACSLLASTALSAPELSGQSLRGGTSSMDRQERSAKAHDFTYLRSPSEVRRFVELGLLVPVSSNANFRLKEVSFPYTRPEVRLFINRLGAQYRRACGEQLVVTSLTRPQTRQPRNASTRSVHPTGMAVDLRRSNNRACRAWLEDVLLYLEDRRVLEATRERRPPHYHIAVFPEQYGAYVEQVTRQAAAPAPTESADGDTGTHRIRRGETLWAIAQRYGTSVTRIREMNGIRSSRIFPGQTLTVPLAR